MSVLGKADDAHNPTQEFSGGNAGNSLTVTTAYVVVDIPALAV
jgi:hypothetical protein